MTKKIAQIGLMLTIYLSIAVAVGCCIALLTPFLFSPITEMKVVDGPHRPDVRESRALFIFSIDSKGFPLAFIVEEHCGIWITKREFIVNNLMWDIAFHTLVAIGVIGMLTIKSKTSKLREYDLLTPFHKNHPKKEKCA